MLNKNIYKNFTIQKVPKIAIIIVVIAVVALVGASLYTDYKIEKGDWIKWDNKIYTQKQVEEKWPAWGQFIEPKNTPEDTYIKFREAVLAGDIDGALEFVDEKKKRRYEAILNDPELSKGYQDLPDWDKIKPDEHENSYRINSAVYFYFLEDMGDAPDSDVPYTIRFIKKTNGYWKLESI